MAKITTTQIAKIVATVIATQGKKPAKKTAGLNNDVVSANRVKSENWYAKNPKLKLTIVKRGLKITLDTKTHGKKTYDGVQFNDGTKAVYLNNGYLKKVWA